MTTHQKLFQNFPALPFAIAVCAGLCLALTPFNAVADHHEAGESAAAMEGSSMKVAVKEGGIKAQCVLMPTEGNKARGIITFTETDEGVYIAGIVTGLDPEAKHGFHIHQYGDISAANGTATGGHYNPEGNDHAGPDDSVRHIGDLGNIATSDKGIGTYSRLLKGAEVGGKHGIIGRGMIVHAGTDDLKSQPTGAAGGRIAQGVIAIIKSE